MGHERTWRMSRRFSTILHLCIHEALGKLKTSSELTVSMSMISYINNFKWWPFPNWCILTVQYLLWHGSHHNGRMRTCQCEDLLRATILTLNCSCIYLCFAWQGLKLSHERHDFRSQLCSKKSRLACALLPIHIIECRNHTGESIKFSTAIFQVVTAYFREYRRSDFKFVWVIKVLLSHKFTTCSTKSPSATPIGRARNTTFIQRSYTLWSFFLKLT